MELDLEFRSLLNLLAPGLLSAAVIWAVTGARWNQAKDHQDILLSVLELGGWLSLIGSALLVLAGLLGVPLAVLFVLAFVVVLVAARRYRESERRALCAAFAIAAERGIPLGHAARAFACESGVLGNARLRQFAQLLDAGVNLDSAVSRSRMRFPSEALLAVRLGGLASDLGPVLRESTRRATALESLVGDVLEKLTYLLLILAMAIALLLWMSNFFPELMDEFYAEWPASVLGHSYGVIESGIESLVTMTVYGVAIVLLLCVLAYLRWLPFEVPILWRLKLPFHSSVVLYFLSLTTVHGRPIAATLQVLASHYPRWTIRKRLLRVLATVDQGGQWSQGLLAAGLINAREAAMLNAAERAGNLEWALWEMSERGFQRALFRFQRIRDILFPIVVMLVGLCVLSVSAGIVVPLIRFISVMS